MSKTPRIPGKSKARTAAPAALPQSDGRSSRARITAIKHAGGRGERVELTELHDVFESLRDATDQPAQLFELAVEEAQVIDSLAAGSSDARSLAEALFTALLRILEGAADGVSARGLEFATERLEKHLRSASGRAMDMASQARALAAVVSGHMLAGELEAAAAVSSRWIKRAEKYAAESAEGRGELVRALSRGVEIAAAAGDDSLALRWACALAAVLRDGAVGSGGAALADALATVAALLGNAGDPARTRIAAGEWLAAERELASTRDANVRADRRIAALGLLAVAAGASGALDECARAIDERVQLASAEFETAKSAELQCFAAGVLAESLRDLVELHAGRSEWDPALAAAREWLELETAVASDENFVGIAGALALVASLTAQTGDWQSCLAATDRLLRVPPVAALRASPPKKAVHKTSTRTRKVESQHADDDWRPIRDAALSFAARAHYARSEYESAAQFARERLSALAEHVAGEPLVEGPIATILVVLAQSEEAVVRVARRGWQDFRKQARAMLAAVDALPRGHTDATLRCATLAWLARAEMLTDSDPAAQQSADDAQRKLASIESVPREVASYVAFVHEITRPARGRKSNTTWPDPLVASARALAAAEAGDVTRAGRYLAMIDLDALASQPDALAHTLAAGVRVLARLPADDRERAASEQAWREVAAYASLLAARA